MAETASILTTSLDLSIVEDLSGLRFEAGSAHAFTSAADHGADWPSRASGLIVPTPLALEGEVEMTIDGRVPPIRSPPLYPVATPSRRFTSVSSPVTALAAAAQSNDVAKKFEEAAAAALRHYCLSGTKVAAVMQQLRGLSRKEQLKCIFSEDTLATKVKQAIQLVELDGQEEEEEL